MLIVHHLGVSQSERIVWLCEELELPYQLVRYEREPGTRLAPPAYKALHGSGTAPVVTDGELTLAESGAIVEYIIQKHGGGRLGVGPEGANYADYLFWLHYAGASLLPIVIGVLSRNQSASGTPSPTAQGFAGRAEGALAMIEQRLAAHPYFAGSELTAADIMMVLPLAGLRQLMPAESAACEHARAYLKRINERPAFQRAIHKADPESPRQIV